MTAAETGKSGAVGRALVSFALWVVAVVGVLATAFFVAMLLTPGYADAVIATFAFLCALLTLVAGVALRRLRRGRRIRERAAVDEVRQGQVLEQLPPSRRRWWVITVAAALLFLAGVAMTVLGSVGGVVVAGFFGILLALSLVQLLPGASWLRVTTRGVVTRHMGRTRAHRWEDIDGFRVYEVHTRYTTQRLIGWSVAEHARAGRRAAKWLRWPHGVDDGLPSEYEADPDELAERLQRYRDLHARPELGQLRQDSAESRASRR